MQHHSMRKAAAGAGAAALIGIALSGPALANPPTPRGTDDSGATITQAPMRNGGRDASAVPQQGPPSYNSWPSLRSEQSGAGSTSGEDSSGFDLAPLALGALGGAGVAGAAALVAGTAIGRRRAIHA